MYITAIKGIKIPLTLYAGPFPLWMVFFVLGVVLANSSRDFKLGYIIVGIVVTFILQVVESKCLLSQSTNGIGYGIKPTSFLFSILMILFLFSKKIENSFKGNIILSKSIVFIGKVSFVVYLSHTLLIIVLSRVHFYSCESWFFRFLTVAIADIAFVVLLYRITPQKMRRTIGF